MSYINDKIVNLRTKRGWSEYELSKIANIRQSTISSWSTKDSIPSIPTVSYTHLDVYKRQAERNYNYKKQRKYTQSGKQR